MWWAFCMKNEPKKIDPVSTEMRPLQKDFLLGTRLDDKDVPFTYTGVDFGEMDSHWLHKFSIATDREKFEMAYSAQIINKKKNTWTKFLLDAVNFIFLAWCVWVAVSDTIVQNPNSTYKVLSVVLLGLFVFFYSGMN